MTSFSQLRIGKFCSIQILSLGHYENQNYFSTIFYESDFKICLKFSRSFFSPKKSKMQQAIQCTECLVYSILYSVQYTETMWETSFLQRTNYVKSVYISKSVLKLLIYRKYSELYYSQVTKIPIQKKKSLELFLLTVVKLLASNFPKHVINT